MAAAIRDNHGAGGFVRFVACPAALELQEQLDLTCPQIMYRSKVEIRGFGVWYDTPGRLGGETPQKLT
jgi:hypothetical protein